MSTDPKSVVPTAAPRAMSVAEERYKGISAEEYARLTEEQKKLIVRKSLEWMLWNAADGMRDELRKALDAGQPADGLVMVLAHRDDPVVNDETKKRLRALDKEVFYCCAQKEPLAAYLDQAEHPVTKQRMYAGLAQRILSPLPAGDHWAVVFAYASCAAFHVEQALTAHGDAAPEAPPVDAATLSAAAP